MCWLVGIRKMRSELGFFWAAGAADETVSVGLGRCRGCHASRRRVSAGEPRALAAALSRTAGATPDLGSGQLDAIAILCGGHR